MKRFIAVLSGLLVLPAFAEVAPVYYDDFVEYTDEILDESDIQDDEVVQTNTVQQKPNIVQRNIAGRSVSHVTSTGNTNTNSRVNTGTRVVATSQRNAQQTTRGTVSRTTKNQASPTRTAVVSRSRANVVSRNATNSARYDTTNKPVTARVSANGTVIPAGRNTTGTGPKTLTDSGEPLYISNVARVSLNNRRNAGRSAGAEVSNNPIGAPTSEEAEQTAEDLENKRVLTESCKAQYAQCMDNYCNVLDDNQGRCSCSSNIKTYEKTEQSLASLTENFQDVVQKIKYIGLTTAQIEALFSETEAELAMKTNSDKSQLKNSLDAIKKKIVDVSTNTTSSSFSDGLTFDLSGLLDMDSFSVFSLESFMGSTKVASQRGAALFNTATQRCRTAVLNECVDKGIDANVITNSYDLAIDKQCTEYERSLNEANTEMRNNVRNAQSILQQARLLLAQKKNEYDLRGCVAALDECMQDEYVCGDDYELCLDPTGKYLAKGEVVKGGTPGIAGGSVKNQQTIRNTDSHPNIFNWVSCGMYGLYSTWDYTGSNPTCSCPTSATPSTDPIKCVGPYNAWSGGTGENLNDYISDKMSTWKKEYKYDKWSKSTPNDLATYLLRKVGYIDQQKDKTYGMCADVMKRCQNYTFDSQDSNRKYLPDNEVVRQYLSLALTKIKLKQDEILSEYAETCWNDVYSCLSTNSYDEDNTTTTASRTAVNACRGEIATCMSVTGYHPSDNNTLTLSAMTDWVASKLISCPTGTFLYYAESTGTGIQPDAITKVSCIDCGWAKCLNEGDNTNGCDIKFSYNATNQTASDVGTCSGANCAYGISLTSSGGQSMSCTCPSGFKTVSLTQTTDGIPDAVPGGTNKPGFSKTIQCKYVGGTEED